MGGPAAFRLGTSFKLISAMFKKTLDRDSNLILKGIPIGLAPDLSTQHPEQLIDTRALKTMQTILQ